MNQVLTRYKDILKVIIVLIVALSIFTLLHILYVKSIKAPMKTVDIDVTKDIDSVDYEILKNDLDEIEANISKSENVSFNENVYKVDFYKRASDIYYNKLMEIKDIISSRLVDDDVKSGLTYDIEKFLKDLQSDDEDNKRYYESTILASLNANINRYKKTRDKCYDVIFDYRAILDK